MDSSCSRTQITTEMISEYVMKPAHAPAVPPHCDGDKALRIETDRDSSLWIETRSLPSARRRFQSPHNGGASPSLHHSA
ncbi:hypothetical protein C8Q76DRAFT_731553 [Earliella scabrosa]|nr:hypothetical protein C8Q76DRAFT_731553 [Earliella scabrosa]